ncbi:unnamed protein product [Candidula unifasciata]|uniref:Uncharacterized protein n=1 Tax=Candidula unifasciata TaxID=100452 RepID=A0A8S3YWG2_9EUPU|nr:unnamed protein product [Candidula unifasciata]
METISEFVSVLCSLLLATAGVCLAYSTTTPETFVADNATVAHSQAGTELMVDAYQNLRDILSKQLSNSYPVPPKFYSSTYTIYASFEPLQIITLDEVLQSISMSSAITLTWRDPKVRWDPREFEGIMSIKLPSSYFWLPTLIIPETTVEEGAPLIPDAVDVTFQGDIQVMMPTITTTLCNLDLTYFPFDDQNCTLAMMESEFYNMTPYTVTLGDMSRYFGTNAAWKLVSYKCYPQISIESTPPFSFVSCHVEIKRRSAFYVINLIGPMGMTSLMTLLAFCVPADGGEKVSFIVSMFMSTSVFYNYIINITPRSMQNLPRVNILLVAIAVQIIFATAAIVFVLVRYSKTKERQKHHQSPNFPRQDKHSDDRGQTLNLKSELGNRTSPLSHQTATDKGYADGGRPEDDLKKPAEKSTAPPNTRNEATIVAKDVSRSARMLSCDQLDILFFCVMCVLTGLLYLITFFV